jgi:hypothetical protein
MNFRSVKWLFYKCKQEKEGGKRKGRKRAGEGNKREERGKGDSWGAVGGQRWLPRSE